MAQQLSYWLWHLSYSTLFPVLLLGRSGTGNAVCIRYSVIAVPPPLSTMSRSTLFPRRRHMQSWSPSFLPNIVYSTKMRACLISSMARCRTHPASTTSFCCLISYSIWRSDVNDFGSSLRLSASILGVTFLCAWRQTRQQYCFPLPYRACDVPISPSK